MNCGTECVKYLLFFFNLLFALGGLAIIIFGVLIHGTLSNLAKDDIVVNFSMPATVLIVIGAIIFIIAFFGCCGAIRESHCMIVTFAVLLLTLLVIQIAIAAYGFVTLNGSDTEQKINHGIESTIKRYFDDKAIQDGVNSLQYLAKCCGYTSYRDYLVNPSNVEGKIPYSCCDQSEAQQDTCTADKVKFRDGCKDKVYALLSYYAKGLGGFAIAVAAVELIGIIFSFCLANSIRNVQRRGYKV